MSELKILIHIGNHLNVVNLLGACTKPNGRSSAWGCSGWDGTGQPVGDIEEWWALAVLHT